MPNQVKKMYYISPKSGQIILKLQICLIPGCTDPWVEV